MPRGAGRPLFAMAGNQIEYTGFGKSREAVFQRFTQAIPGMIGRAESETDTYGFTITLGNEEISENNFDTVYQAMVGKYVPAITFAKSAPINTGPLALSTQENTDLNVLLPQAHDKKMEAAHMYPCYGAGFNPAIYC